MCCWLWVGARRTSGANRGVPLPRAAWCPVHKPTSLPRCDPALCFHCGVPHPPCHQPLSYPKGGSAERVPCERGDPSEDPTRGVGSAIGPAPYWPAWAGGKGRRGGLESRFLTAQSVCSWSPATISGVYCGGGWKVVWLASWERLSGAFGPLWLCSGKSAPGPFATAAGQPTNPPTLPMNPRGRGWGSLPLPLHRQGSNVPGGLTIPFRLPGS